MTEENQNDFYRPSQAVAQEMRYSTDELVRRLELTKQIIANLKYIRAESAGLEALEKKIASIATTLRLLKELAKDEAA